MCAVLGVCGYSGQVIRTAVQVRSTCNFINSMGGTVYRHDEPLVYHLRSSSTLTRAGDEASAMISCNSMVSLALCTVGGS